MSESRATPCPPDPLEEGLARALPRIVAHAAERGQRVAGFEPEDVAQEVALRALRYRTSYDPRRALLPWLRRIAARVVDDCRRLGARRPQDLEQEPAVQGTAVEGGAEREQLARLLASLRPLEREVLVRFHQREQSVREIAAELRLPEGTVKSHLSRARRRLAEEAGRSGADG